MRAGLRRAAHTVFFSTHRPADRLRLILRYHSVGRGAGPSEAEDVFRSHVRYLAKWFRIVRLSEFLPLDARSDGRIACVTFDDGYVDNVTIARRVLEDESVVGTFFVITGLLGRPFATSAGPFPLMTPDQVKVLAAAGHEIGSHTVTHPQLTEVSPQQARTELVESKRFLEDLLGAPVQSFAYPKGRVDAQVRRYVEDAGYRQAVTTQGGTVEPPVDPFMLPRLGPGDYIRATLRRRPVRG